MPNIEMSFQYLPSSIRSVSVRLSRRDHLHLAIFALSCRALWGRPTWPQSVVLGLPGHNSSATVRSATIDWPIGSGKSLPERGRLFGTDNRMILTLALKLHGALQVPTATASPSTPACVTQGGVSLWAH